jgi:uncharacterized repeat protein (TIGR01451 family)
LSDPTGSAVNVVPYGGSTGLSADANQSVTRSPDIAGKFIGHQAASGGVRLFSPGTQVSGAPFIVCGSSIARVEVSPAAATVEISEHQQFTTHAFDAANNEVPGVIFLWQSSDTAIATIDEHGLAASVSLGATEIRATGRGVVSAPATMSVRAPTPVLTSISISPATAVIGAGETQQFTAQAKDQTGQAIGGAVVTFASNDTSVATVDVVGSTSPAGSAIATVTGQANGSAEIKATATNGSVTVSSAAARLTVEPGAGQLLISEFRTRGPAGAVDEFIEIYNPTISSLKIGGLRIRASNNSGTISDRLTITAGIILSPGCHYLFANAGASGYSGAAPADQLYGTGIADDGGLAITSSNGTRIIDAVGMSAGSALKEGSFLVPLTVNADHGYERKPGGSFGNGVDTNQNAADFLLTGPSSPQNASTGCLDTTSADLSLAEADTPNPVTIGSNITYTLTITNNGPAVAKRVVMTDNLPANVSFVSCSASGGGVCAGSGNNRTVTFESLASGAKETAILIVIANGPTGTGVNNSASIGSSTFDANPLNNSATSETTVQAPLPSLSIGDVTATEGNSGTTTFSFTVNLSAPAPGPVTFDMATLDGSATSAGNDYVARSLTNQTIASGQQTYAFDISVNGDNLVEPGESFFVNVTNISGASPADIVGLGTIQNDDAANLVISQVYGGGNNSGAPYRNDFVELFNRGTTSVDFAVTPYAIQYAGVGSNFGSAKTNLTTGLLAPGHYFLIQESGGTTNGAPLPPPDAAGTIAVASTAGKIALVFGTAALATSTCPGDDGSQPLNPADGTIVDFVGYGSAVSTAGHCYEGPGPAAAPGNTTADVRKNAGCTDSDNNALDFAIGSPVPRNNAFSLHDCNTLPLPDLSISDVTAAEGNGGTTTFNFTVSLSSPAPAGSVSFDIATQDNSAIAADNDYVPRNLTNQHIPGGEQTYNFAVTVNGDLKVEPDESFFVNVTNVSGANINDGQATGTIQNDDAAAPPNISLNDAAINEGNSGTVTLTFTVSLSSVAPAEGVTFDIATQDNTATIANSDYLPKSLTVQTIPAGQQTYSFDVAINGDKQVEAGESLFVNLSSVVNANVTDAQGLGTLNNDDGIVISQIYGGGGNAGSTLRNDFIELHNRSTTTIDISAWSVQYLAATSTTGSYSVTNLCAAIVAGTCSIAPGQYFLVKLGGGSGGTTDLPAPDVTGTTDMSATAGKVAVVINRTALSGTACQASAATVTDFVGYGTTANCFEGSGRAPAPSATNATFRKASIAAPPNGCLDTDDNASDFVASLASPRNKLTSPSTCP